MQIFRAEIVGFLVETTTPKRHSEINWPLVACLPTTTNPWYKFWNLWWNYNENWDTHYTYTVLHMFRQVLFGAGNQSNHQNFEKSLLSCKCELIFIGMKQKKIFLKDSSKLVKKQKKYSLEGELYSLLALKKKEKKWKLVNMIARIFRNFDDYPGFQPKTTPA